MNVIFFVVAGVVLLAAALVAGVVTALRSREAKSDWLGELSDIRRTSLGDDEEVTGAIAAIPYDDEDEAVALANATDYGLAASLWTGNVDRAHRMAAQLDFGIVWVNCWMLRDLRTPFGGVKASGLGHEGGYRSIDFYTDQQAVHINLGEVHNPVFGQQDPH